MTYEDVIAALADPTRRGILEALRDGPRSVNDIAEGLPVSRPAVSQHLAVLLSARLVSQERDGTRRLYEANAEGLEQLRLYLESFWGQGLAAFAVEARRRARDRKPGAAGGAPGTPRTAESGESAAVPKTAKAAKTGTNTKTGRTGKTEKAAKSQRRRS